MTAHETPRKNGEEWELVIAELTVAMHERSSSTPAADTDGVDRSNTVDELSTALAERIMLAGSAMVRGTATSHTAAHSSRNAIDTSPRRTSARSGGTAASYGWRQWGGWFAAAAVLIVAVTWQRTPSAPPSASAAPSLSPTLLAQTLRDSLLVHDRTVARIDWTATADSSARGASGDVVWSSSAQSGVMRLAGLQPNDRSKWQYQLWIFDKRRDQRYPVDGGVFDIPSGSSEVLVPINARVPVGEAIMFAITIEPPGGVVVSSRERIALLAKAGG